MTGTVMAAINQYLQDTCSSAIGAFVYGSVATGQAGPDSDVDCFVLLAEPETAETMTQLRSAFAELQVHLGYTPDLAYPIELFTVRQCEEALDGSSVRRAIQQARTHGYTDPDLAASDEVEVLRALLGTRLTVRTCLQLDELTDRAKNVVVEHLSIPGAPAEHTVLQALGVRTGG
ncbi:nucleotidyltransferase family protein [Streptomyces boncukensis]|uniref:Nucleotidyltransferase domain-containing protein n=1 Tax=Streptomyces boncukensis TaxID=2711219 RepID=A0A6G4WP94_9ACTN|nr:nucleotidyltransferase domain-containing protein [Streptomyces boncukensis]NGO67025.1 nucleotidyltransferase domain-containing protein [Streptomyces boncukensis]